MNSHEDEDSLPPQEQNDTDLDSLMPQSINSTSISTNDDTDTDPASTPISSTNLLVNNVLSIVDGTVFKFIRSKSTSNVTGAICIKCEPKNVEIRGGLHSTSNFLLHLK